METKFKFNSQVCTSIDQSRRLLALGLKKETADMHHSYYTRVSFDGSKSHFWKEETGYNEKAIPAWSLHRLWELLDKIKKYEGEDELSYPRISLVDGDVIFESPKSIWARRNFCSPKGAYENIINCFEDLIKEGYFNKEYLV